MMLACSLGSAQRACTALPGSHSRRVRIGRGPMPRQPSTARRQLGVVCYKEHSSPPPPSHDLDWAHVSRDLKAKVSKVAGSDQQMMEQLQSWLSEARLGPLGESSEEDANQTEVVAQLEGDNMGLPDFKVDVKSWLGAEGEEGDTASKMAGVLTLRLLQAYHQNTGEPFDDDNDDSYWRLQGFIPGGLVEALDHDTLRRLIRGYALMPFSGA